MNFITYFIQLILDSLILTFCCDLIFKKQQKITKKNIFIFLTFIILCILPRIDVVVSSKILISFRTQGFEIFPANNITMLLFLIFGMLLVNSIFLATILIK